MQTVHFYDKKNTLLLIKEIIDPSIRLIQTAEDSNSPLRFFVFSHHQDNDDSVSIFTEADCVVMLNDD